MRRGHGRSVVIVAPYPSRRLVEHLASRSPVASGGGLLAMGPAAEEEGDEAQEQGDCPFDSFHGDSFQGVWEYLPRI